MKSNGAASSGAAYALEVRDLEVAYRVRGRSLPVLRGVTFSIPQGESYGLVGESGCGKSTVALTIARYLARNGRVVNGEVRVGGRDMLALRGSALRDTRAHTVSMVYQDPSRALNPSIPVGRQVAEVYEVAGMDRSQAERRTVEMLVRVQIADPESVAKRYPHQLSGGMQQRVVIAMALAKDPALLILDEPTTGLDATVEAEVLDLVGQLRAELGASVLFISHNLGLVAKMCDRVGVLYAGALVEEGPARELFGDPRHPYTVGLLRSIPRAAMHKDHGRLDSIPGFLPAPGADLPGCVFADRCALADDRCRTVPPPFFDLERRASRCYHHERAQELPRATPEEVRPPAHAPGGAPILEARNVSKAFRHGLHHVRAVTDVTVELARGETLGLVGESGSGKTTFARTLLGLTEADPGSVMRLDGEPLGRLAKRSNEQLKALQIIFQNPDAALNKRRTVKRIIRRALTRLTGLSGKESEKRLRELADGVRLPARYLSARPGSLSGGLRQRVAIACAFAGDPRIVVCDEPTSALDVSVQAAILNLLVELQRRAGTSYLFISHDLAVVRYVADRIAVMYLGRLMEIGDADRVFSAPHHPYTEALLSAATTVDGEERARIRLEGEIPSPTDPPSGCVFHTRCPRKLGAICETEEPPLADDGSGRLMRCHIPVDELRRLQGTRPVANRAS